MKYRLKIDENISLSKLEEKISNGAKFIVFEYCISIVFAVTLRRFSPAILIENDEDIIKFRKKYNILSLIFGWWGIPWGPIYTMKSLSLNKKGGLDITNDIMLNITQEGFNEREINLLRTNQLFCKPSKWDLKTFKKAIEIQFERDYNIVNIVVGLLINTDESNAPFYIGIRVKKDFELYIELLKTSFYKHFRDFVCFEFINLSENTEESRLLEEQGESIINRTKFNSK